MKATMDTRAAREAVAAVAPYCKADRNSGSPVYNCVKLVVEPSGSYLVARDIIAGLSIRRPVDGVVCEVPGTVLIDKAQLENIVTRSTGDKLSVAVDATHATIKVGRSSHKVAINTNSFADPEPITATGELLIAGDDLMRVVKRCKAAVGEEMNSHALSAIHLHTDADRLFAIGADGRRLARADCPIEVVAGEFDHKPPASALVRFANSVGDDSKPIRLRVDSNILEVETETGLLLQTQLLQGKTPSWERLGSWIEGERQWSEPISARELRLAVAESSAVADARTGEDSDVGIIDFAEASFRFRSIVAERGNGETFLDVNWPHPEHRLGVRFQFVSSLLASLGDEQVQVGSNPDAGEQATLDFQSPSYRGCVCSCTLTAEHKGAA